jgi:hypothetical protein
MQTSSKFAKLAVLGRLNPSPSLAVTLGALVGAFDTETRHDIQSKIQKSGH